MTPCWFLRNRLRHCKSVMSLLMCTPWTLRRCIYLLLCSTPLSLGINLSPTLFLFFCVCSHKQCVCSWMSCTMVTLTVQQVQPSVTTWLEHLG